MRQSLWLLIVMAGVIGGIYYVSDLWKTKTAESMRTESLLKLRGDYLEQVAWLNSNPSEAAYKNEIGTFLRMYFKEVNEHLNRHGGNRDFDDYLKEKGKKDKAEEKKAAYEYTRKMFDLMKGGTYSPLWTGTSAGIRLDILSADIVRQGGEEKIHLPVVAWGVPREEREDDRKVRRVSSNARFSFNWRLTDEKGKLLAEIPGEGGPDGRVDWPERYIRFFPPGTLLGYYDLDKLPAEVKNAEITWSITGRSPSGGDIAATYTWKLEVPAAWKLGSGETWKGAQESIRPEEEIDPAAAAKANRR